MLAEKLKKFAVITGVVFILVMFYLTSLHSFIDAFYLLIMLYGVYVFVETIDGQKVDDFFVHFCYNVYWRSFYV